MGTPDYAAEILRRLAALPGVELRVVTKPDAPIGRRQRMTPSAVAAAAARLSLPTDKPGRLADMRSAWHAFLPNLLVTAAYGRILPPWLLALPVSGAYNLHASLLPRWRGPNPIAWAIRAGDAVSGVTLMEMDAGVDTGPIVAQSSLAVDQTDTTGSLSERLAKAAGELLVREWPRLLAKTTASETQAAEGVSYAPKFLAEDLRIDWSRDALGISRQVRSMMPEPGAYTAGPKQRIKILEAVAEAGCKTPGRASLDGNDWLVGTGDGLLRVVRIQPAGRPAMSPGDYMRGLRTAQLVFL